MVGKEDYAGEHQTLPLRGAVHWALCGVGWGLPPFPHSGRHFTDKARKVPEVHMAGESGSHFPTQTWNRQATDPGA